MTLNYGQYLLSKAIKDYSCWICKKDIPKGEFYPIRLNRSKKTLKWFSIKFCSIECVMDEWNKRTEDYKLNYVGHKGRAKGSLIKATSLLTPEQRIRRRRLLQIVTNKYRPRLLQAYERKSTERVHKVMQLMYNKYNELDLMGVDFPLTLVGKNKDYKLSKLMDRYDNIFIDRWLKAENKHDKVQLLLRPADDAPRWDRE